MKIKVFHATIRRDAHTITPITVPEHEIAILQTIFGEESVHNQQGRTIAENKLTEADVAGEVDLSEGEFDRLAAKYGGNDEGLFVEQVYGKRATGGLDKAIERYAEVREKKAAAEAAAAKKAAGRDGGKGGGKDGAAAGATGGDGATGDAGASGKQE